MKTRFAIITALVALAFVTPAQAAPGRFSLGLRGSCSLPFGEARGGTDLQEVTTLAVPVQLDVDYHVDENWRVGAYVFYGPVTVADEMKRQLAASGMHSIGGHRQQRVGVQVARDFRPAARLSPWVGVALGYDWTRYAWARLGSDVETEIGVAGFEATMQLGTAYKVSRRLAVGPFVAFDLGRYGKDVVFVEGEGDSSTEIADKAMHQWVRFGVKLSYGF